MNRHFRSGMLHAAALLDAEEKHCAKEFTRWDVADRQAAAGLSRHYGDAHRMAAQIIRNAAVRGNRTFVFGRIMLTTTMQPGGAPLIDRCCVRETQGPRREASGIAVYLAFWRMLRKRFNRPPGKAFVIARIVT